MTLLTGLTGLTGDLEVDAVEEDDDGVAGEVVLDALLDVPGLVLGEIVRGLDDDGVSGLDVEDGGVERGRR